MPKSIISSAYFNKEFRQLLSAIKNLETPHLNATIKKLEITQPKDDYLQQVLSVIKVVQ